MEALNKYLEILAGYVFDNDKLVTYKWLSNELHVHVNLAKQILWKFYQEYKNKNIECTYLLIGLLKNNEMRIEVVKESTISKAKEKFSKIISEHLYSVHKPLTNLELLATSGSGNINYSAIKCDACKERSDEEMQLLRWGTVSKKVIIENKTISKPIDSINLSKKDKNSEPTKKSGFNNLFGMTGKSKSSEKSIQEQDKSSINKDKNSLKENENLMKKDKVSIEKAEALKKEVKELTEKKKDSVENDKDSLQKDKDFSKNKGSMEKNKNSLEKKKNSVSSIKKLSPKSNSIKKGSLDNFFEKCASPSKSTEILLTENKNNNAKEEVMENKKIKKKTNLHGRKRNRSKEIDENAKKRKRIVVQSDSSDSEIQSDIEMEELVPESPEPENIARHKSPSPLKVKHENGKRKVLKLINKTYKEGEYIVTKKEHVYVSCSEDEEEEKKEEKRKKEMKKEEAKIEKIKKKQSTLTDFFKKS